MPYVRNRQFALTFAWFVVQALPFFSQQKSTVRVIFGELDEVRVRVRS